MTPASTTNLLRTLFVIFCFCIGLVAGETLYDQPLAGASIGLAGGLLVVLIDRLLKGLSLRAFSSATIGLLMGSIFAGLLNSAGLLRYQSEEVQWATGLAVYAIFAYLGMMLAMRSNRDEFSLIIPYVRFSEQAIQGQPVLLDTNVIIGGRLKEICDTGFLSGSFIVPEFVVSELQRLADSSDTLKRERGRRGLDHLHQLQRDPSLELTLVEGPSPRGGSVDDALIELARRINARILTDDTSMTKVARLQGVRVLSFHELNHALRPVLAPGDEKDANRTRRLDSFPTAP
jgi:uncharacterized protein YacL